MIKWILAIIVVAGLGVVGYGYYDYRKAGLHLRPEMPPGAFSISYKNGLRAIIVDVEDEQETRRYFGYPFEVPFYLEDAWSFCSPPEGNEIAEAERWLEGTYQPGMRIDAICKLDVDGQVVVRGLITSVPRL